MATLSVVMLSMASCACTGCGERADARKAAHKADCENCTCGDKADKADS